MKNRISQKNNTNSLNQINFLEYTVVLYKLSVEVHISKNKTKRQAGRCAGIILVMQADIILKKFF